MPLGANRIAECSFPRVKVSPLRIPVSCLLASQTNPLPPALSHPFLHSAEPSRPGSLPSYRFTYSTLGAPRERERENTASSAVLRQRCPSPRYLTPRPATARRPAEPAAYKLCITIVPPLWYRANESTSRITFFIGPSSCGNLLQLG